VFRLKCAWSSAATPLPIVCPTNHAVPPDRRNIFVDDCESAVAQHAVYFVQDEPRVLCVMKDITKQHGIEALIFNRKMAAVVWKVIDTRSNAVANIQPDHSCAKHPLQMMCDEAVAATYVEHSRSRWKHAGDFECHVICSTNFAAPFHALEATLDNFAQACH